MYIKLNKIDNVCGALQPIGSRIEDVRSLHVSWSYYGHIVLHNIVTNLRSHIQYNQYLDRKRTINGSYHLKGIVNLLSLTFFRGAFVQLQIRSGSHLNDNHDSSMSDLSFEYCQMRNFCIILHSCISINRC